MRTRVPPGAFTRVKGRHVNLTVKHLRIVAFVCGLLLVGFGLAKALFHLDLGDRAERWITDVLFVVAALAFLQMFKLRRQARGSIRKP